MHVLRRSVETQSGRSLLRRFTQRTLSRGDAQRLATIPPPVGAGRLASGTSIERQRAARPTGVGGRGISLCVTRLLSVLCVKSPRAAAVAAMAGLIRVSFRTEYLNRIQRLECGFFQ
ncbi:MAG: hypothetical protein AUI36_43705 [Cyanobacteria bacterium 13_1_40CM_2_61_4]|nr:MAG: hypothetical protein AUI36_43705 [Cyanobacteria bacterium 13_1_40CM_2_61_4]